MKMHPLNRKVLDVKSVDHIVIPEHVDESPNKFSYSSSSNIHASVVAKSKRIKDTPML